MTSSENKTREESHPLAFHLESQMGKKNMARPKERSIANRNRSELPEADSGEMTEAPNALRFLEGVRKIIHRKQGETLVEESTITGLKSVPADPQAQPIHDRIGRFEILETIGEGGFARVFRARDPLLNRDVALKIPKPHALLSAEARARFEREGKAAAVLSHPAIVQVYETGTHGPCSYIATEFCPGETLADWIDNHRNSIDLTTAAEIVARLSEAVHHAHQRGVVHRDLKPANILVQNGVSPMADRIRITDFGLAKHDESESQRITIDGSVIGTPAYMSPEQARGSHSVDHATDIFSLGVILYELLTGVIPFHESNHLATLKAIENRVPVTPRKINAAVPRDLEAICLKCINKSSRDRYATAHDLSEDLLAWLAGRTVSARHATAAEKMVRWARRQPALAAALAFGFCSLTIGLVVSLAFWQQSESSLLSSELQRERAQSNVQMLEATIESILNQYVEIVDSDATLSDGHRMILSEVLEVHKKLIDAEAEQLDVTLEMVNQYAQIIGLYWKTGEYEQARQACRQAELLVGLMPRETAEQQDDFENAFVVVTNQAGVTELEAGNIPLAVEHLEKAAAFLRDHPGPGRSSVVGVYRHLGYAYTLEKRFELATWARTEAIKQAQLRIQQNPADWQRHLLGAVVVKDIAELYATRNRLPEAVDAFRESLELLSGIASNPNFENADVRYRTAFVQIQLANTLRRMDDRELVMPLLQSAIETFDELLSEQPENVTFAVRRLQANRFVIYFLHHVGELEQLETELVSAISLADENTGKEQSVKDQVSLRNRYANVLHSDFGETEQALGILGEAIQRGTRGIKKYPYHVELVWYVARSQDLLETMHQELGNIEASLAAVIESVNLGIQAKDIDPQGGNRFFRAREKIARACEKFLALNQFEQALSWLYTIATADGNSPVFQFHVARQSAKLAGIFDDLEGLQPDQRQQLVDQARSLSCNCLQTSIDHGFDDFDKLDSTDDWKSLEQHDRFQSILESVGR